MINKKRILTPGPTPMSPEIQQALGLDMIHHRKKEFNEVMARISDGLKYLFGTDEVVLPLSCSGTGAMCAAVNNLFAPGEMVLVVIGGVFGQRWKEIAEARGLIVISLNVSLGKAVDPEDIAMSLQVNPQIKGVLVQASETSTGVLHPIKEIGEIVARTEAFLVVDGISAVSVSPCPMDKWKIDCLVTASQKGLMLPPGLSFIALSQRAWDKQVQTNPNDFYFNLLKERKKNVSGQTAFTSPVNLIRALDVSLNMLREITLRGVMCKQWAFTQMIRTGVKAIGLQLFVEDSYTWGLTSISVPDNFSASKMIEYMEKKNGVIMAGAHDILHDKIIRFAHMGYVDFADMLAGLYALGATFEKFGGHIANNDYLNQAMIAYETTFSEFTKK